MEKNKKKIICNQCGKEIKTATEFQKDFLEIKKQWGYFSNGKDGQLHEITLCEDCYDEWIQGFFVPPVKTEITEFV